MGEIPMTLAYMPQNRSKALKRVKKGGPKRGQKWAPETCILQGYLVNRGPKTLIFTLKMAKKGQKVVFWDPFLTPFLTPRGQKRGPKKGSFLDPFFDPFLGKIYMIATGGWPGPSPKMGSKNHDFGPLFRAGPSQNGGPFLSPFFSG